MNRADRRYGQAVFLIPAIVLVVVIAGWVVFTYIQVTSVNKEAKTATDAAALAAAIDMGRIVVAGPMGPMALLNDTAGTSNSWPVCSVNTVAATLRVDAIIAQQLKNPALLYLVQNDMVAFNQAMQNLTTAIQSSAGSNSGAVDKNGNAVTIQQDALAAYTAFNLKLSNNSQPPQNFVVQVGTLSSTSSLLQSGVPLPNPISYDTVSFNNTNSYTSNSQTFYLSGVDIPVDGLPLQSGQPSTVRLVTVASNPSLIDPSAYQSLGTTDVPVSVSVSCAQPINGLASTPQTKTAPSQQTSGNLNQLSYAQVGGRFFLPNPGVLEVAYPTGIPTAPVAVSGGTVNFASTNAIMSSSVQTISSGQIQTTSSPWTSQGTWYTTSGGPVPGSGSIGASPFKSISSFAQTDSSVALDFCVYDWLRSLAYRPNMQSVVTALQSNYSTMSSAQLDSRLDLASGFVQPTYASSSPSGSVTSAILTILPETLGVDSYIGEGDYIQQALGTVTDPRSLANYQNDVASYQRQQANTWGYVPADASIPTGAAVVSVSATGTITTTDGNPYSDLLNFLYDLYLTNSSAVVINQSVMSIISSAAVQAQSAVNQAQSNGYAGQIAANQAQALAYSQVVSALNSVLLTEQATVAGDQAQQAKYASGSGGYQAWQAQITADSAVVANTQSQIQNMVNAGNTANNTAQAAQNSLNSSANLSGFAITYLQNPKNSRVLAALINSTYVIAVTNNMITNLKALTSVGCKQLTHNGLGNSDDFQIGGSIFHSVNNPWPHGGMYYDAIDGRWVVAMGGAGGSDLQALVKIILLSNPDPKTGIDPKTGYGPLPLYSNVAGSQDWCLPPSNVGGQANSQLVVYQGLQGVVLSQSREGVSPLSFVPPALAQTAAPALAQYFHYQIQSNAWTTPTGQASITVTNDSISPYTSIPTGTGEDIYQSTSGLVSQANNSSNAVLDYQIQARDEYANTPTSDNYFAQLGNGTNTLAAAWEVSCPMVPPPPSPPGPPNTPLFTALNIPAGSQDFYCGYAGTADLGSWLGTAFYPWAITSVVPSDGSLTTPWGTWQIRRYGAIILAPPTPPAYVS